jgi:tetratricopeptide (TPR) repeat protein
MRLLLVPTLLLLIALGFGLGGLSLYNWIWGPDSHLRAARQALEQRDFTAANQHLAIYLAAQPESAEGHLLAAQAIRRSLNPVLPHGTDTTTFASTMTPINFERSYEEAEQHLLECERLSGVPDGLRLERYLLAAQQGDLSHVAGGLRHLVNQEHPDSLTILEALAKGYLLTYRLPEAVDCLNRWLERREDVEALVWRGWVRERLSDSANALLDYRRAVELDADNVDARWRLAELLIENSHPGEAIAHWEHLHGERPDGPGILLGLAQCWRALGQTEDARRLLDDLLARHPRHVGALTERGTLALDEQQPEEAEGLLRRAVALAPFNKQALYVFSQCLKKCGKTGEYQASIDRLEKIRADFQRLDEILRLVQKDPRDPAPRCEAGLIYLRNGHNQEGMRWLTSALREDSRHGPTHQALADHFQQRGDPEQEAFHRRLAAQGRTP